MDERSNLTQILRAIGSEPRGPRPFGSDGRFTVAVAATPAERLRAWRLVHRSYVAKEFARPDADGAWYALHDALPDTTTILATHGGRDVGAVTVVLDSPLGLPADEIYGDRLAPLRAECRRPCEFVSLASDGLSLRAGTDVLMQSFRLAMMSAFLDGATDLIITVSPRHAAFYQRTLLFSVCGEERSCAKVGGVPAVLLQVPFDGLSERFRAAYGTGPSSLWSFFFGREQTAGLYGYLRDARRPLARDELIEWFVRRRPLMASATLAAQRHVQACYPGLEEDIAAETAAFASDDLEHGSRMSFGGTKQESHG
ncbi:MAG: hypothetical protein H0W83_14180 [Planctomycetes bacterium]|nr:hypothetical protein [Planctomycetota bacterium]